MGLKTNDTVLEEGNLWYEARLSEATPTPSAAEQRARALTEAHANTPTTSHVDGMGRTFLVQAHNGFDGTDPILFETRTKLDIEGQVLEVRDPLDRPCQTHAYSMAGLVLRDSNIDKGERLMLASVLGEPIRRWDDRDQVFRTSYDALRRPTHLFLTAGVEDEVLLEKRVYGEVVPDPEDENLRGKLVRLFDQAGAVRTEVYDFKGNLKETTRILASVYDAIVDWSDLDLLTTVSAVDTAAVAYLETETFTETRDFDALNRVTSIIAPDASVIVPTYNEANLLESVEVTIRGTGSPVTIVENIDYDAKGQRTLIEYGNGTSSEFTFDELTFRLIDLVTTRTSPANTLQGLHYTFDPVGNVLAVADDAQQTVFFDNAVTDGSCLYEYDPTYRLVNATGREHASSVANVQRDNNDQPINTLTTWLRR